MLIQLSSNNENTIKINYNWIIVVETLKLLLFFLP